MRSHWSPTRPVTGLSASDLDTNCTSRSSGQGHITVLVLRHQQRPATVPLPAYSRPFLMPFLRQVESVLEERSSDLAVVPVHPQPHTDHPVVALLHTGKDEPICPVVCFQVHRGHPSVDFWTDCLEQPLLLSTVEAVLGPDWQAGSIVLVGDSPTPLRPSESRDVAPGTLIRVFLPHCGVIRACSLRDRIRDPEQYCSIFEQDGPPAFAPLSHTYGLLQPLVVDKFVQYSPLPGQDALEDVLLSHVGSIGRPMRLCWPAVDIRDFAVRGKTTSRVVGAFPSFAETRSPVFLDARPIGQSLRLVASLEGVIPLTVFFWKQRAPLLRTLPLWTFLARLFLGSGRSSGSRPCVSEDGAPLDDTMHANAAHGQCALPVLLYDVAATSVQTVDTAADAHVVFAVSGLVDLVCGRQSSVFDCVAPFSLAAVTWNPGFLVTALSSRCREDTPASCFAECSLHWPHSMRQELAYRLALSAQHLPAIVFDDDDNALPSYFITHDPFQGPVGPHEDDAVEDDMTDSEPSMNCIEARIFCFQGPTRSVSLWFHLAEQVDEFLVRADILHNPDAEFLQLLPVMPHPDLPFMALLMVPRWWSTVGLTSALFVDELAGGRCFLHTAHAVETFEHCLLHCFKAVRRFRSSFLPGILKS